MSDEDKSISDLDKSMSDEDKPMGDEDKSMSDEHNSDDERKPKLPPVILNTKEIFSNEFKSDKFSIKHSMNFKHKMILCDKCVHCLHNSFYSLDNESIVLIIEKNNKSYTLFAINLQKNEKISISEDNDFSDKKVKGFDFSHYQDIQNHRDLIILSLIERYPSKNNYIYIYDFKARKKILNIINPISNFDGNNLTTGVINQKNQLYLLFNEEENNCITFFDFNGKEIEKINTDKKIYTFKTHIYKNQNHIVIGEFYQLEVYNFDDKKFIKKYIDPDDEKENKRGEYGIEYFKIYLMENKGRFLLLSYPTAENSKRLKIWDYNTQELINKIAFDHCIVNLLPFYKNYFIISFQSYESFDSCDFGSDYIVIYDLEQKKAITKIYILKKTFAFNFTKIKLGEERYGLVVDNLLDDLEQTSIVYILYD